MFIFLFFSLSGEEKTKNKSQTVNELISFGDKYNNSNKWQEAVAAGHAFFYAKSYDKTSAKAQKEYDYTAKRVSVLLLEEGKKNEKIGTIEALLKANDFYTNSFAWNKENTEAAKLKDEIKPKLAELYYTSAKAMDTKTATNYAEIKELYENALKWVSPYKDCQARIYSLSIRQELVTLKANVAEIEKEQKAIEPKIKEISASVNKAKSTVNKIRFISESMNDINNTADEIDNAISPLTGLPVIGVPLGVTLKSVNTFQIPVSKATTAINLLNDPLIYPLFDAVDISYSFLSLFEAKFGTLPTITRAINFTIFKISENISTLTDESKLKSMDITVKKLNKDIVELKTKLLTFTTTTGNTASAMNSLSPINPYITPVEKGIKAVSSPIASIGSSAHKINRVLDKNIAMGYSARDALKLTGGLKWIMNKALGFLNPVLKELSKSLPQIPGTEAFTTELKKLQPKGTTLFAWDNNKHDAQKFEFVSVKGSYGYYIARKLSGKVIDAEGGETKKNGVNVQVWDINGGKGQQWTPVTK